MAKKPIQNPKAAAPLPQPAITPPPAGPKTPAPAKPAPAKAMAAAPKPAPVAPVKPVKAPAAKSAAARPVEKAPAKAKEAAPAPKPGAEETLPPITNDDIALRAYFIAEKRQALGIHRDAHHDWLEAEQELQAEQASLLGQVR